MSIFRKWQPLYAKKGIATFPVGHDKKPRTKGYLQTGLRGSGRLAQKFVADAFGFGPGARSKLTILDVDTPDEGALIEAQERFGQSSVIVQTPGGFHAYYRHRGERRHIRPEPDRPWDILGGGYVIAPPSQVAKGEYQFIHGTLDDLKNLPSLSGFLDGLRWKRMGEVTFDRRL
jgi:Bifunctional DNA primase/polymerase, N-terminal